MRDRIWLVRFPCVAVLAAVAGCAPPGDSQFSAGDSAARSAIPAESAPVLETDGSIAALTAEVRQLRAAVEQLARSQTEGQALAVALSAQQRRVEQLRLQLDEVRAEIDQATARSRGFEEQIARFSQELSLVGDLEERDAIETELRAFQTERDADERALTDARGRESNLSRALALEENRWNELLARAGQL